MRPYDTTIIVPFIQPGWRLQWYWYVPGTVNVIVNVLLGFTLPESKDVAPLGTDPEVTVCCVES